MAKGCSNNKYEEARKQRLEENKKRFEDLGISTTAKNLTEVTTPVKKSPNRFPKPKSRTPSEVEPRRSSRARNLVPSYREEVSLDLPHLRKRSRSSSSCLSYIARPLDEIKEATNEERIRALEAAEALQINLQSSNPSFVKSMVRSHVYSCFWLGLPSRFCEKYLPKTAHNMILEDESGSEYEAVYLGNRTGLSGGWRGFALEHKLDDGDALVFELVDPTRFKIYIVRAFLDLVEKDDENNTSVEEENTRTTKSTKASNTTSNRREAESNKAKKPKQAIVSETETKESKSSQESLPENITEKEVKPQKKMQEKSQSTTIRNTRSSQRKMQKKSELPTTPESQGEAEAEIEKPKEAIKISNKGRKSKEGSVSEIDDLDNTEKLLSENNVEAAEAKPGEMKEIVEDADSELKKVEADEEAAGKRASRKPRKKPAPKLFRKRA